MNHEQSPTRYFTVHLILTLAGLAGTAGVFLPFAHETSPWNVIVGRFYFSPLWALQALLAPLATAGTIRWLISGSLSVPEKIIAYLGSASMIVLSLSVPILFLGSAWFSDGPRVTFVMSIGFSIYFLTLALGIGALIWNWRLTVGGSRQFSPVVAIQAVYVAHAALWLAVYFFDGWNVGAYFVLVATLVFATQIVLVLVEGTRRPTATPAR